MGRIILMALMLAVTVAGCNRFPDLTIQIVDVLAADDDPTACTFEEEQEQVLFRGVWDLAVVAPDGTDVATSYDMVTRVESYIIDNSLVTQAPQGNMNIRTFNVLIKLPDGSTAGLVSFLRANGT